MRQDSPPRPASLWTRFWSPTSLLEPVPFDASADEAAAIRHRNDVWLKTYMDMYILRWGLLWLLTLMLAVFAFDEGVPSILFAIAVVASLATLACLAVMIRVYRRAVKAIEARTH